MSDKTREVYEEKADVIPTLNPFVDTPRMRVSAINRLNELIERNNPKLLKPMNDSNGYECPKCGKCFGEHAPEEYKFCYVCGQRLDKENVDF